MAEYTILVVEDEPEIADLLKKRLEANGYKALIAYDGLTALSVARKAMPDLIILDLMLPKMDGYSVSRMLKFDKKYREIPIIILTAKTRENDKRLGDEVGADLYMTKPFDSESLLKAIRELLSKKN